MIYIGGGYMVENKKFKISESEYNDILKEIDETLDDFIDKIKELKQFRYKNDLLYDMGFSDKYGYVSDIVIEQLELFIERFNIMLRYKQLDMRDIVGKELYKLD